MKKSNRLSQTTSPYLQQHAQNPVDWYPWSEEALQKAKNENKPILVSIGYSACHWCHVMAHESFEDEETAKIMNEFFINIKVDREERPDLDKIYQTTHYLLTHQGGGWPLTIFLSPKDLTPFFSGTYFPREARYNLPSFKEVLLYISKIYHDRKDDIEKQNKELKNFLQEKISTLSGIQLDLKPIGNALTILKKQFDYQNGGFGSAPKFPQYHKLEFLLRHQPELALQTLKKMAEGGICDQLGGGFFRYSVDERWEIPHFEKMLYDNAQQLLLYALASQDDQSTMDWAFREMRDAEGGFFSSMDADTEGKEGEFYLWGIAETKSLLTSEEYQVIYSFYNLNQAPNFEEKYHLHITHSLEFIADQLQLSVKEVENLVQSAKTKLLTARNKRPLPHIDKKILTSWNALMIKSLLIAGDGLNEPRALIAARKGLTLIKKKLWRDQHLFGNYMQGEAYIAGYLDDYAFLLDALLTALQIKWETENLIWAQQIADSLCEHFFDRTNGGFFFTSDDQEKLLYRPKTFMDDVIPSGNAVVARTFTLMGFLLGEPKYLTIAENILQTAWTSLQKYPAEHCGLLLGLEDFLNPKQLIIIRGEEDQIKNWQRECKRFDNIVFAIPHHEKKLPPALAEKKQRGKTCAYVCRGNTCSDVILNLEDISRL